MKIPPPDPSDIGEDKRATYEAASLSAGVDISKADANHALQEKLRYERIKVHIHRITVCGIWGVSIIIAGLFLIMIWHIAISKHYAFLDEDQLTALKQILLSGGVGAVLSHLIGRRFVSGD